MKLSEFDTKMPLDLIAEHPAKNRDESRLLVLHRHDGEIEHREFKDILDYFGPHDLFVFNDTQVFPAKLMGNKEKTGARIEVFLLRELNQEHRLWDVLVEPARKIRIGNKLYFGLDDSMVAEVIDNTTSRGRTLRFLYDGPHDEFKAALFALGSTPLPYYIKRESEEDDVERYQTIFARKEGAVVVPAAATSRATSSPCTSGWDASAKSMWKTSPSTAWTASRWKLPPNWCSTSTAHATPVARFAPLAPPHCAHSRPAWA